MKLRGALLGLIGLAACGPGASPQLQFDFVLSALLADQISEFQVSLVTEGKKLGGGSCLAVQATCLVNQITLDRYIRVVDSAGVEHPALVFPLNLKAGTTNSTQDLTVQGIPPGKDYAIVIEALSKDAPPKLAGSFCDYLPEITVGTNTRKLVNFKPLNPPVNCDPRVEK